MPYTMPYHLETGPTLGHLERYLNSTNALVVRTALLGSLRDQTTSIEAIVDDAVTEIIAGGGLSQSEVALLAQLPMSLTQNWLGANAAVGADPFYSNPGPAPQGQFRYYEGNVAAILRETFVRALEVSMEIAHGDTAAQPTVAWPIVLMWKCAQAWFEGWVQWRTHLDHSRTVIVVLCTPGDGNHIAMSPTAGFAGAAAAVRRVAGFEMNPTGLNDSDSLVVTDSEHVLRPAPARSVGTTSNAPATLVWQPVGPGPIGAPLPWFGGMFTVPRLSGGNPDPSISVVGPAIWDGGV